MTAANDSLEIFYCFSEHLRLDISCESSAKQRIHMKHQALFSSKEGWSGGAMGLGKLPVPGRPTIWITVGQRPTALAVRVGVVGHFYSHLPFLSSFSLSMGDGPM